jgi:superfamily I DNA/RNA helicase
MIPRSKLDPDQNRLLDQIATDNNSNYWISGFAGSGKSVLIVAALIQAKNDNPDLDACVVLYTHSLIDLIKTGIPDDLEHVPVMTYHQFRKGSETYDLILVDEVQDLPRSIVRQLRERSDQLIMAGDDAQSIYTDCIDPDQLPDVANAERFPLTIIHRLPRNIIRLAKEIFPEKNLDAAKQDRLKSIEPRVGEADTEEDELEYVWTKAKRGAAPGNPSAILLPTHREILAFANDILHYEDRSAWSVTKNQYGKNDYRLLNQHLRDAGLPLRYFGNRYGRFEEADRKERVFLMTYHSVKGLDFETVLLPRLNHRLTIGKDDEELSRTLFFVAFTRSRENLYLTYTGTPHRFIEEIPDTGVHTLSIPEPEQDDTAATSADEIVF